MIKPGYTNRECRRNFPRSCRVRAGDGKMINVVEFVRLFAAIATAVEALNSEMFGRTRPRQGCSARKWKLRWKVQRAGTVNTGCHIDVLVLPPRRRMPSAIVARLLHRAGATVIAGRRDEDPSSHRPHAIAIGIKEVSSGSSTKC